MKSIPTLSFTNILIMLGTFILAMILTLLPLPEWGFWFRPAWVELLLCFWILYIPQQFQLIYAWLIGLSMDVLLGTALGEHAFAFTLLAYGVKKFYQQIRMFPLWQQALGVSFVLTLYQLLITWMQAIMGQKFSFLLFWSAPILTLLLWPILVKTLKPVVKHYFHY